MGKPLDGSRIMLLILIGISTLFVAMVSTGSLCGTTQFVIENNQPTIQVDQRLGDKCRCVFLDVGANRGIQTRKLFEPDLYPGASWPAVFNEKFGSINSIREECCSICVEPNPMHAAELKRLQDAYNGRGWRVHIVNKAAWNSDNGGLTFVHEFPEGKSDGKELSSRLAVGDETAGFTEKVPSLDLAAFIQYHVLERTLPSTGKGTVVMKLDTEGAEFTVFPHLLSRGVLCGMDMVATEFHMHRAPSKQSDWGMMKTIFYDLLHENCNVTMTDFDDEIYYDSNFSLPE